MPIASTETRLFFAPFACLKLQIQGQTLSRIDFLPPETAVNSARVKLTSIEQALHSYFASGQLPVVPLHLPGSAFQQRVWQALQDIPSGQTLSYGQLARILRTSPRAVGNACRANPIPLFVPCHRVVAAHDLGGFMGKHPHGTIYKQWLLDFEARIIKNNHLS